MEETLRFIGIDKKYEFVVKAEFAQLYPDYMTKKTYNLIADCKINNYLHNPSGVAITRFDNNQQEYWIDGKKLSDEESKLIKHKEEFDKNFFDTIEKT